MSKQRNVGIAVTPSIKLRASQAKLYEFIVQKYKTGGTITLPEVVREYSKYGNRMIHNGTPYSYVYDWKNHKQVRTALEGDELRTYAISWFIRNLGVFVVKGLLTAVPTMELSQLQIESENSNE